MRLYRESVFSAVVYIVVQTNVARVAFCAANIIPQYMALIALNQLIKGAPGLAGRDPPEKGVLWSIRCRPLPPTHMARARRQADRPTLAQVWFDVGRTDLAPAAVADNAAVRRDSYLVGEGFLSPQPVQP